MFENLSQTKHKNIVAGIRFLPSITWSPINLYSSVNGDKKVFDWECDVNVLNLNTLKAFLSFHLIKGDIIGVLQLTGYSNFLYNFSLEMLNPLLYKLKMFRIIKCRKPNQIRLVGNRRKQLVLIFQSIGAMQ